MKRRWVFAVTVGALVLGGVLMVGYGGGVTPASADNPPPPPSRSTCNRHVIHV